MPPSLSKANWSVYILRGKDASLYTGITTDLDRRVHEHNNTSKGAKSLRGKRPLVLVWHLSCDDRSQASSLEASIKTLNKRKKEELVEGKASLESLGLYP